MTVAPVVTDVPDVPVWPVPCDPTRLCPVHPRKKRRIPARRDDSDGPVPYPPYDDSDGPYPDQTFPAPTRPSTTTSPAPDTTKFLPAPTWPTPSGITEQRAREACVQRMASSAVYSICSQHVDLKPVVTPCVLNIQACIRSLSSS